MKEGHNEETHPIQNEKCYQTDAILIPVYGHLQV